MRMASSWMFCVVVLLCYNTQLQTVFAGEFLVSKQLDEWIDDIGSQPAGKVLEKWLYSAGRDRLTTVVKPGGASWFITPPLNLPNTSYLEMEASCSNNPCQLEIYGTNGHSLARCLRNFEFIQNITFATQLISTTTTIRKSYPYLRILARTLATASRTTFYIHSIKIRYYVCENTTISNTDVSQVYSSTTNISLLVQCQDNALTSDGKSTNITVRCTPKGNWTFGDLKCVCGKGFFSSNQSCTRCLTDHYKTTIGDESCKKCLVGTTNDTMHTQCKCKKDHYIGNDEVGPCYAVPSEVYDLQIQTMTSTSVNLTWKEPVSDGGFGTIRYTVECYHCTNESKCDAIVENAMFFPAKTNIRTTSVVVSNLIFNEKYKFKITSMNSLKNVPIDKWTFAEKMAVVGKVTQTTNTETKCKCEEKVSNSIVMFFAGTGTTLIIVLFIILVIQLCKRCMNTSKESTNVHAVETVEMQVHSPAQTQATQSQTNQGYLSCIGDETTPYEDVSPPSVYTELNRNQQDATVVDNTYQKLLKHDSGYALPLHGELETSYEDVIENNKAPSNYQELDSTKHVLDDSASYQKLTNFQRSPPV